MSAFRREMKVTGREAHQIQKEKGKEGLTITADVSLGKQVFYSVSLSQFICHEKHKTSGGRRDFIFKLLL